MPIRIRRLNCRVKVKTGGGGPSLHKEEKSERPVMSFVMPAVEANPQSGPEPSQTATENRDEVAGHKTGAAPRKADPRAVSDRVYDLMKQEIYLAQLRGGKQWRN